MYQHFDEIHDLMEQAFPESERRIYEEQKELLDHPNYELVIKKNDHNKIIAFMAIWNLETCRFIEHFAVDSSMRGHGIGGKFMSEIMEDTSKPIILEVEHPDTTNAKRRISFYENLGYHLNEVDYAQPPLREGEAEVPLYVMSYPEQVPSHEFDDYKNDIFSTLYDM